MKHKTTYEKNQTPLNSKMNSKSIQSFSVWLSAFNFLGVVFSLRVSNLLDMSISLTNSDRSGTVEILNAAGTL